MLAVLAVAGCMTPAQRIDRLASTLGFTRDVVAGADFEHVVYRNGVSASNRALHIYIEGDGRPYVNRRTIARDPTPNNPVMLQLMALDSAPSVYLGRPCYFGLHVSARCAPVHWTIGRFSEEVVGSMAAAAGRVRGTAGASGIVLIGHSGGGALAVLLARRLPGVEGLVTIAGNLDVAGWADLHGYAPLSLSLNPSAEPPLADGIRVLHLVGGRDTVVPAELILRRAPAVMGEVRIIARATHSCCWAEIWPGVLDSLPSAPLAQ